MFCRPLDSFLTFARSIAFFSRTIVCLFHSWLHSWLRYDLEKAFIVTGCYTTATMALVALVLRPVRPEPVAPRPSDAGLAALDTLELPARDLVVEIVPPGQQPQRDWHFHRSYSELVKMPFLVCLMLCVAVIAFGSFIPSLYVVKFAMDEFGTSSSSATLGSVVIGASGAFGKSLDWRFVRHSQFTQSSL
eukprot:m.358537 g.358537  ORF g.358537 m.358537 type:complete len:190 (+) comp55987_c0_seq27:776-1345(+)